MAEYYKKYYEENKEHLKAKSNKRYHENKDKIKRTTAEYRKSDDYKISKAKSNQRIQDQRRLSSVKADLSGKLGVAYTDKEDVYIIRAKESLGHTYQAIADELERSMKGVEYRYNLLRKKREAGDESIPSF